MRKIEKSYINLEFSYNHKGVNFTLLFLGEEKVKYNKECDHCGKELKKGYYFQDVEDSTEWFFGPECVKHVWGIGLK